jgi:spore germination protein YaaH
MSSRSRVLASVSLLGVLLLGIGSPTLAVDPPSSPTPEPVPVEPEQTSIHAEMLEANASAALGFTPGAVPAAATPKGGIAAMDGSVAADGSIAGLPNGLTREVFGYLPYWMLGADDLANLDYSLVSTLAYFSVGVQSNGALAKTGVSWNGWTSSAMTSVINAAHARGVKVVLTVTAMGWNSTGAAQMRTLLASSANRSRLANEIADAVKSRHADGVNLDFEPVPADLKSQYVALVRAVKARLVATGAGSHLTAATMAGAATWSTGYDIVALTASGAADALMVMAYDFSWSGSARAGGVAPISSPYMLDVGTALQDHLAKVPASKLIWGVPYYGREWSTDSAALNATTNDVLTSAAAYYTFHRREAAEHGRRWDSVGQVPWYRYESSTHDTWVQGYYDDVPSLTAKYDLVNVNDLRGIGIWHLLMDGTRTELWQALDDSFQGAWFEDVIGNPFRGDILWIANEGITAGCGVERFCPKATVTREQMASFLARALNLPAASRDWFDDDGASSHQADINRIAEAGITGGCATDRFCPRSAVTREQMASFLARALELPNSPTDFFADDDSSAHEGNINRLAQAGITGGCATDRYCPNASILREQMAAFLRRALES